MSTSPTTTDLSEATSVTLISSRSPESAQGSGVLAQVFQLNVPSGWRQGHGAFGGLIFGAMTRAVCLAEDDPERSLRSLAGVLVAPVAVGEATITVTTMRRGQAVSAFDVALTQNGETLARASAIIAKSRAAIPSWSPPAPAIPPHDSVTAILLPHPPAPEFANYFEFRPTGLLPFSDPKETTAAGFIRPRRAAEVLGPAERVAISDAWWPAAMGIVGEPRPISTIAFNLQYFANDLDVFASRPLFHRANALAGEEGYITEMRELWTEDGTLLTLNQQTFAMR